MSLKVMGLDLLIRGTDDYFTVMGVDPDNFLDNIYIPARIQFNTLTSIKKIISNAFKGRSGIKGIRIGTEEPGPELIDIGDNAFEGCSGLTSITIPDSLRRIGYGAFINCSSLISITIPDSIIDIPNDAFNGCSGLTSITLSNSLKSIGAAAFSKCSGLTSVTIPDSVNFIIDGAFEQCSGLTSITLPKSLPEIMRNTFRECSGLTSVIIPASVTSIGDSAFLACLKLTSVVIPDSVTSISSNAFSFCSNLSIVVFLGSPPTVGNDVFLNCPAKLYRLSTATGWGVNYKINDKSIDVINLTNLTYEFSPNTQIASLTRYSNFITPIIFIPPYVRSNNVVYYVKSIGPSVFENWTNLTAFTIPPFIESIGPSVFAECSYLKSITIPPSVTSIGNSAFKGCSSLTSVTIPTSVTSIGNNVFEGCSSLTSITIPTSVTSIGNNVFKGCSSLTSITIPASVTSISEYAFDNCRSLTSIIIPASVKTIGNGAFYNCSSLTSITIPASVTYIGNNVFERCINLKSITIPNSVLTIGSDSFLNCQSLTSITIPNSVTSIGAGIFYRCVKLTSVTLSNSLKSIGKSAFTDCWDLPSIIIPASVTSIGDTVFYNCSNLRSVFFLGNYPTIFGFGIFLECFNVTPYRLSSATGWRAVNIINNKPITIINDTDITYDNFNPTNRTVNVKACNNKFISTVDISVYIIADNTIYTVTSIGDNVFEGCSKLISVTIPTSVTSIGNNVFMGCSKLTSITIPASVTSIGANVFEGCSSLTSVTIPTSVTSIGDRAFFNCSSLTSVTIPASVTSIGDSAFVNCSSLTSITIPTSVTSIGNNVFRLCSSLTSVTIPTSVTSIDDRTFDGCSSLTSVTIPTSVTYIGNNVFEGCSSLTSVTIPTSVTSIGGAVFVNCSKLISVTIPVSITSIGEAIFAGCSSLTSVTIPNSVETIGTGAFARSGLTSIIIPSSVTSIGEFLFVDCVNLRSVLFLGPPIYYNAETVFYGCPINTLYHTDEHKNAWDGITNPGYVYAVLPPINVIGNININENGSALIFNFTPHSLFANQYRLYYTDEYNKLPAGSGSTIATSTTSPLITSKSNFNGGYCYIIAYNGTVRLTAPQPTAIAIPHIIGPITTVRKDKAVDLSWPSVIWNGDVGTLAITCSATGATIPILNSTATSASITGLANMIDPTAVTFTLTATNAVTSSFAQVKSSAQVPPTTYDAAATVEVTFIPATPPGSTPKASVVVNVPFVDPSNPNDISKANPTNILGEVTALAPIMIKGSDGLARPSASLNTNIPGYGYDTPVSNASFADAMRSATSSGAGQIFLETQTATGIVKTFVNVTPITDPTTPIYLPPSTVGGSSCTFDPKNLPVGSNVILNITPGPFGSPDTINIKVGNSTGTDTLLLRNYPLPYTHLTPKKLYPTGAPASIELKYFIGNDDNGVARYEDPNIILTRNSSADTDTDYAYSGILDRNQSFAVVDPDFNYICDSETVTAILTKNNNTDIITATIPASISKDGVTYTVTSIGNNAFEGCSSLTSVIIPVSITSIGANAFEGCSSLTSVIIPDTVTSISANAFEGCSSLTSITVPVSITSISSSTFSGCSSLSSIIIPASVMSIGNNAFEGCSNLTSILFLGPPPTVGEDVFQSCPAVLYYADANKATWNSVATLAGLATYVLPPVALSSAVDRLYINGEYNLTFNFTPSLFAVEYKLYYTSEYFKNPIGASLATSTSSPLTVTVPTLDDGPCYIVAYKDGVRLTAHQDDIQLHVEGIYTSSYNGTTGILTGVQNKDVITRANIPDWTDPIDGMFSAKITIIGDGAFKDCVNLSHVNLTRFINHVGNDAFSGCSKLKTIIINDNVLTIGQRAFYNCSALTSIIIPASVMSISNNAFEGCSALTSILFLGSPLLGATDVFKDCPVTTLYYADANKDKWANTPTLNSIPTAVIPPIEVIGNIDNRICNFKTISPFADEYRLYDVSQYNQTPIGYTLATSTSSPLIATAITSNGGYCYIIAYSRGVRLTAPQATAIVISHIIGPITAERKNKEVTLSWPSITWKGEVGTLVLTCNAKGATIPTLNPTDTSATITGLLNMIDSTAVTFTLTATNNDSSSFAQVKSSAKADPNQGSEVVEADFTYLVNSKTDINTDTGETTTTYNATLIKCNKPDIITATIPESITFDGVNYTVTSIGDDSFEGCLSLTSIIFPDSVRTIGDKAFSSCSSLTSIIFPATLTSIGQHTFSGCSRLTSIIFPAYITSIGYNAFELCSTLESVLFLGPLPTTDTTSVFEGCPVTTLYYADENNNTWSEISTLYALPTSVFPPIGNVNRNENDSTLIFNFTPLSLFANQYRLYYTSEYDKIPTGSTIATSISSPLIVNTPTLDDSDLYYIIAYRGDVRLTAPQSTPISLVRIVTQPTSHVVAENKTATLAVSAINADSYQWYTYVTGPGPITPFALLGANKNTLEISYNSDIHTLGVPSTYGVTVIHTLGEATSDKVTVTFTPLPKITEQPVSVTIESNAETMLSVVASEASSYQWQKSELNIDGETSSTFTVKRNSSNDLETEQAYRVLVSNTYGNSVTSNEVTVTFKPKPVIVIQPASIVVSQGKINTLLSVEAQYTTHYTWEKKVAGGSFTRIDTATGPSFDVLRSTQVEGVEVEYRVILANENEMGETISNVASVTFTPMPKITEQPVSSIIESNAETTLSVVASEASSYQWQKGGVDINGAITSTLTVKRDSDDAVDAVHTYRVIVSNTYGNSVTSNEVTVTFKPKPVIFELDPPQLTSIILSQGEADIDLFFETGYETSRQWEKKVAGGTFTRITGETDASLRVLRTSQVEDAVVEYRIVLTNDMGETISPVLSVTFLKVPAAPSDLNLVVDAAGKRTLSWPAVAGAKDYRIELWEGNAKLSYKSVTTPSIELTAAELIGLTSIKLIALNGVAESEPFLLEDTPAAKDYRGSFELIEDKDFTVLMSALPGTFVYGFSYSPQYVVSVDGAPPTSYPNRKITLAGLGTDGNAHTIRVTIYSLLSTITTIKTSTNNNYNNVAPPPASATTVLEYLNASSGSTNALPRPVQERLLTAPLTQAEIAAIAAVLPPTGIKMGGVQVLFPTNNVALVTSGRNKIRIPDGPSSPIKILADGTTVQYMGIVNGVKTFTATGPAIENSPLTVNDGDSFDVMINGVSKSIQISFGSINIDLQDAGNSFPARVNPYLALSNVLIYTKATVDALVAGNPLPATPRVAWAENGVTAGSLMRDLNRIVMVADSTGRHLQRWARIQYLNGSGSEGVDDSLADYGCGWVCVWDASGIAPVY